MDRNGLLPSLFGRGVRRGEDIFTQLQGEIDRVFDSFAAGRPLAMWGDKADFAPAINMSETPEAIEVTAEIPGCEPKDIEVSLVGNELSIRGEKKTEVKDDKKNYHMVERSYGGFLRTIALPFEMDPTKVDASFDKGVLKVVLPKPPEAKKKAKTIPIKG
jgi:HSP20 family protein